MDLGGRSHCPENGLFRYSHVLARSGYAGSLSRVSKLVSKSKCQHRLQVVHLCHAAYAAPRGLAALACIFYF